MNKKKIGIIIPSLSKAGAEKVAAQLSIFLSDDYKFHYILFHDTQQYPVEGDIHVLKVNSTFGKISKIISYVNQVRKLKKKLDLDLCISFLELPNILNLLTSKSKVKTIVSVRNYISYEYEHYKFGKQIKFLIRKLYNKSDLVISVSDAIKKDLVENFSIDSKLIRTVYNPINLNLEEKVDLKSNEIQKVLEWKEDSILLLNVGRLEYQKNQKDFISIISRLIDDGYDVKGIVLGEGSLREQLEKQICNMNMSNKIKLLGHQENPYSFYSISDIYLLTSFFEGFPNALIESMSFGNFVISTNCNSGPSEILETSIVNKPGSYGLLISDLYQSDLSDKEIDAIKSVLEDKYLREDIVKSSLRRVRDFSYENTKKRWEEVFEEVEF